MYKYIVCDLDGTLLNSHKNIGECSKNNITRLKEKGIHFIIATGRHYQEIKPYIQEMSFSEDDYIICCNGQYIYKYNGDIYWKNIFLNNDDLFYINTKLKISRYSFYTNNCDYHVEKNFLKALKQKIYLKKYMRNVKIARNVKVVNKIKGKNCLKIEKICISLKDICISNISEDIKNNYTVHVLKEGRIEIHSKSVSKMKALEKIILDFGVNYDEILYFGDDENDLECFQTLPHCIAMANASKKICYLAEEITKSCDEDGVGIILERLSI